MIKFQFCDLCGNWDITGTVACINKQLCPDCGAKVFSAKPDEVRAMLTETHKIDKEVNNGKGNN